MRCIMDQTNSTYTPQMQTDRTDKYSSIHTHIPKARPNGKDLEARNARVIHIHLAIQHIRYIVF